MCAEVPVPQTLSERLQRLRQAVDLGGRRRSAAAGSGWDVRLACVDLLNSSGAALSNSAEARCPALAVLTAKNRSAEELGRLACNPLALA